jgi:hypothetical protein
MAASRIAAVLVLLSIGCALVSNILNARVMGQARLGVAVLAPPKGSPEWNRKVRLLWWADALSYAGIVAAAVSAVILLRTPDAP